MICPRGFRGPPGSARREGSNDEPLVCAAMPRMKSAGTRLYVVGSANAHNSGLLVRKPCLKMTWRQMITSTGSCGTTPKRWEWEVDEPWVGNIHLPLMTKWMMRNELLATLTSMGLESFFFGSFACNWESFSSEMQFTVAPVSSKARRGWA